MCLSNTLDAGCQIKSVSSLPVFAGHRAIERLWLYSYEGKIAVTLLKAVFQPSVNPMGANLIS